MGVPSVSDIKRMGNTDTTKAMTQSTEKPMPHDEVAETVEWVIVPKIPTTQMVDAMCKTMPKMSDGGRWVSNAHKHRRRWAAALASAPKPPEYIAKVIRKPL